MMALSRRERRALREIEEILSAEDPALAGLMRRSARTRRERVLRMMMKLAFAVAVLLVVLGLFLSDAGLLTSGLLMMVVLPPTLWLVAFLMGEDDSERGDD
jgi:peptidoglycan/LPS O-acetylase OafA/YrhL